ncbi:hypothetical protein [Bacteroides sp.]|uniref:hypothetical protein n=1 Tax=Bacteroides sp. TaxID=29523 RepID=UPI00260C45DE|nr:hypothetical protein [Bacteroides sp.]MDD3038609.1 hypothetical protein [Bacteroides sp.]
METEAINALLSIKAKQQSERYSSVKAKCLKECGIDEPFSSDIMGYIHHEDDSLEGNLLNLLAIANNNMVAGLYSEYKSLSLEKKLEEEKKLKHAAFLFILKHGLINEFQSFMNDYKGDVKDGIFDEIIAKHA